MSLAQTTALYVAVLTQLLPEAVYDAAPTTVLQDDIYAHAKLLAQTDLDAHRLLQVLESIPVELLNDYEQEYGLPMQCMVPGSLSIQERINMLQWIRTSRNVMNREYLEQLLAVFGVTLVHLQKYYPMQCTGTCVEPVNTERLRYKVLLELQYPMAADMSCIIENYLPGYLRVDWQVDIPLGDWILNSDYSLVGDNIRYTAYKTNQRDYYDSYADFDLVTALMRSFHDEDLQTYVAFTTAVEQLSGSVDWVLDPANNAILYKQPSDPTQPPNTAPILYYSQSYPERYATLDAAIDAAIERSNKTPNAWGIIIGIRSVIQNAPTQYKVDVIYKNYPNWVAPLYITAIANPNYDPEATDEQKSIPLETVAKKVISNAESSNDQVLQLLSQDYIDLVINSIFETNPNKQFVKLEDLISQFEYNKTLRV